jgi:hypothetical protein
MYDIRYLCEKTCGVVLFDCCQEFDVKTKRFGKNQQIELFDREES